MGKKRISDTVLIMMFLLLSLSCTNDEKILTNFGYNDDPFFVLKNKYKIDKGSLLVDAVYIRSLDNKKFYFSNVYAKAIYKTKKPFTEYIQIGKNGKGPSEYIIPYQIYINNNSVYYSDLSNGFIKRININNKNTSFHGRPYSKVGATKVFVDSNYIYTLGSIEPHLNIFSKHNGKLIQSLIELEDFQKKFNSRFGGGGICFDKSGYIYASCVSPYEIYKIQNSNGQFRINKIFDFKNLISNSIWTKEKEDIRKSSKSKERKMKLAGKVLKLQNMEIIGDNIQYLFINLVSSDKKLFHVISLDGKLIKSYINKSLKLVGHSQNALYFFEQDEGFNNKDFIYMYEYGYKI